MASVLIVESSARTRSLMKTMLALFAVPLLAALLAAAPLMETTAIHAQPDAAMPAIGYLKAGTEPAAAANATAPEGWMAVDLPGPHEAYVSNGDFTKSLDIRPGAPIRLLPKNDAAVLITMQDGDKIEITGLRSGWTQIKLNKAVVGYIKVGGISSAPVAGSTSSSAATPLPAPVVSETTIQSAPVMSSGPASGLPRSYQGTLVATKRFLLVGPRPDYDYQLNDVDGKRAAYLDVTKVLATQKMDLLVDRPVVVSGVIRQTNDGKNLVIAVTSLEPK